MKRGEAKVGQRVLVPWWLFPGGTYGQPLEVTVTLFVSRWRGEVNVVEVERDDGLRKRVNVRWLEPTRPLCGGCGQEIDPDYCHCGEGKASHRFVDDHPFIPMGCDCYRASG